MTLDPPQPALCPGPPDSRPSLSLSASPIPPPTTPTTTSVAINNAQSIRSGYAYDQKSAYDERSRAGSLLMFVHLGFIIRAAARAGRIVRMYRQVETGKFKLQHSVDLLMGWKKEDEGDAAAAAAAKGTASARIKGGGPAGASMRNPKSLQVPPSPGSPLGRPPSLYPGRPRKNPSSPHAPPYPTHVCKPLAGPRRRRESAAVACRCRHDGYVHAFARRAAVLLPVVSPT